MQKKLLAVAVAGALALPVIAAAQSSVTISGRLTWEYGHGDQGDNRDSVDYADAPGGSNIRFAGQEALGGGLTAWFQCETSADTRGIDQVGLCSRNSAVGLRGGFGNVYFGVWDTPFKRVVNHGTVGAVALDQEGNLAAGTSTGGTTNKQFGRIGDSPIIGAGTYADNESCAVSATGAGEFFIRWTVAYDIAALMKYRGMSVKQAAEEVIHKKLTPVKGAEGGVIALDAKGNFAMPFNTEGMYRGWIGADGVPHVEIYKD